MKMFSRSEWKTIAGTGLTAVLVTVFLVYSRESARGVLTGLHNAAELLIPSLFPFMVLSSLMIRSGLSDSLGKCLAPVTKRLFRLPEEASAAVLLSFLGGFPVGARCVRLLYDSGRISRGQADRMMLFCVCSGPAFLITGIGTLLLHRTEAGVVLYLSQVVSGLVIGLLTARLSKGEEPEDAAGRLPSPPAESPAEAFMNACQDGADSVLSLTAMVAVFSLLLSVGEALKLSECLKTLLLFLGAEEALARQGLPLLLEVTAACRSIGTEGGALWMLALASGFGGLCVHFQIFFLLGPLGGHKARFFLFRGMNAFLSAAIVYTVSLFSGRTEAAFSVMGGGQAEVTSTTLAGAGALLLMSLLFVVSLRRKNQ